MLSDDEIYGAWRCLCLNVLLHAVTDLTANRRLYKSTSTYRGRGSRGVNKESLRSKGRARQWASGRNGLVTFEDCCDVLDIDVERARGIMRGLGKTQESRA